MTFKYADFDHNAADFRADPASVYAKLRAAGVGHSDHYGGFWVAPTYADVQTVAHDVERYTPAHGTMLPPVSDRPLTLVLASFLALFRAL